MKLKSSQKNPLSVNGKGLKICIVFSGFNEIIGSHLLKNTLDSLVKNGVSRVNIEIIKVPGALEIPFASKECLLYKNIDAVITLGIVIKGETPHFDLVANESYRGIMNLNITFDVPVIFGIITANNPKQALDRALRNKLNKGNEFAIAAIQMAQLAKSFKKKK